MALKGVKSDNLTNRYAEITRKRCKIRYKLVLFATRKSQRGFQSVLKSVTLSDLEHPSGHHYVLFHTKWRLSEPTASDLLKLDPYCQRM